MLAAYLNLSSLKDIANIHRAVLLVVDLLADNGVVWCTVSLDADLGIVIQRRCPDESTRTIHRVPLARSS
jgi:hypothetical protein